MKKILAISTVLMLIVILSPVYSHADVTAGNWYLQASTQVANGISQIPQIGASLSQEGPTISGVLHVSNSGCFDWSTDIPVSGTVIGGNVTLTSDGTIGEIVTINASVSPTLMTGTYAIQSGCADGDYGTVTAVLLSPATGNWTGGFGENGVAAGSLSQALPNSDGYSLLSGSLSLSGPQCTVSGSFVPNQSWILGNVVQGVVNLSDGSVMALNGFITDAPTSANEIVVNFSITGGTCSGQSGTLTYNRQ